MNYILEVIYDTSDAETLTEVDEFTAMLDEFESKHPDIEVIKHDWSLLEEEEKQDLKERFQQGFGEEDDDDEDDDEENDGFSDSDDEDDDGFDDDIEEEDEEDIRIPMILFNEKPLMEGYYPNAEEFAETIAAAMENKEFE